MYQIDRGRSERITGGAICRRCLTKFFLAKGAERSTGGYFRDAGKPDSTSDFSDLMGEPILRMFALKTFTTSCVGGR